MIFTLISQQNLDITLIQIRLFPMIPAIGTYSEALPSSVIIDVNGIALRVLSLPALQTSLAATNEPDTVFFLPLVEATDLLQRMT